MNVFPTFLPDTTLRRTPSSLSRPKNCTTKSKLQFKLRNLRERGGVARSWVQSMIHIKTLDSCTGPLLCRWSSSFYIMLPQPGKFQAKTISRQANQAASHQVIDPSSNLKSKIKEKMSESNNMTKMNVIKQQKTIKVQYFVCSTGWRKSSQTFQEQCHPTSFLCLWRLWRWFFSLSFPLLWEQSKRR